MSDLHGPLARVTIAFGLWVIPLAPLVAAAYVLYLQLANALAPRPRTRGNAIATSASTAAVLGAVLAFGWTAFQTLRLSQLDDSEPLFLEHVFRMVRVGQLDLAMDLAFDPLASVVALVVSGVGLLFLVAARARGGQRAGFFAWASLLLGATLLAVLADGLIAMFVGWEVAALAAWGLTRNARAFTFGRLADATFLVGTAMLFWGLGGVWSDAEYTPDLVPRFAAVRVSDKDESPEEHRPTTVQGPSLADDTSEPSEKADDAEEKKREESLRGSKGLLTMTAYPGALLFMDDSRTPLQSGDQPLRPPFARVPIDGGVHSFRIHPGGGLDDYLVPHVPLGKNREIVLTPFGPTVTFRQMHDQLAVSDAKTEAGTRGAILGKKALGGASLLTVSSLLLLIAATARSARPIVAREPVQESSTSAALVATSSALLGIYLLLRLEFLFSLSVVASAVVACTGGVTAISGAAMAARALDLRRVVACLGISELGLAMLGAGAGAPAAAALELIVSAACIGALWMCVTAIEQGPKTDVRALGGLGKQMPAAARVWLVATVGLFIAPLPGLGSFWSKHALLGAAFSLEARFPGWLLFGLGAAGVGIASHAAWRAYLVVFEGKPRDGGTTSSAKDPIGAPNAIAWTLAGVGAIGGAALGIGGRLFGSGRSISFEWLESLADASSTVHAGTTHVVQSGLAAVIVGAAIAGWSLARARYGEKRRADWYVREAPPEGPERDGAATPGAATVAAGVERWVLDGVYAFASGTARAAAFLAGALDDKLLGIGIDTLAEKFARFDVRMRVTLAAASVATVALVLYLALHRTL